MAQAIKKYLLDTNVLLRFLVGDIKEQQSQAIALFRQAEDGQIKIIISPLVIAETCFVLESFYKKNRQEISDAFEVFLSQNWLKVEDREVMLLVWKWYRRGVHFVDSFLLSKAKLEHHKILTFDKQLMKKQNIADSERFSKRTDDLSKKKPYSKVLEETKGKWPE